MIGKYFLHHHTHHLKVVGSNPTPATKHKFLFTAYYRYVMSSKGGFFVVIDKPVIKILGPVTMFLRLKSNVFKTGRLSLESTCLSEL
jgi:hypothetical protein